MLYNTSVVGNDYVTNIINIPGTELLAYPYNEQIILLNFNLTISGIINTYIT